MIISIQKSTVGIEIPHGNSMAVLGRFFWQFFRQEKAIFRRPEAG